MKKQSKTAIQLEQAFWNTIKVLTEDHFSKKLEDLLEIHKEQFMSEFQIDLKTLVSQWQERVYRSAKRNKNNQFTVGRKKLVSACKFLGMKPPLISEPVDLKEASKQMKSLARSYHPDVHGGNEETRDLFEKTIESFEIVRDYNSSLRSNQ